MNRGVTNIIRYLMDELVPSAIRDSKWFMYPFFWYAYRGKDLKTAMSFKTLVYKWSEKEYSSFYNGLNTISRNRKTDLNESSIKWILSNIDKEAVSLLDVGCGKGYFLERAEVLNLELTGCDIVDKLQFSSANLVQGFVEKLPFENNSFDVVTCSHTLEHIIEERLAVKELLRVAKKQLVVVVPRQRYYYYTLDEHVNFYLFEERLSSLFKLEKFSCKRMNGDWVYIGKLS